MILRRLYLRFRRPTALLAIILAIGTYGYWIIGGETVSLIDCFYMTFITVATIGFTEVIDLTGHPGGRMFTILIGFAGIGTVTYIMSSLTAFILEGELNAAFRRQKMVKSVHNFNGHYIVCGVGRVGTNVANEVFASGRQVVVIERDEQALDAFRQRNPGVPAFPGDASEDDALREAGIDHAAGVFAVTGDDSKNLVVTLSAKALNPALRVVARCHEVNYIEKIRKVGADAIVSPDYSGAIRVVSSMLRPNVTRFLDEMTGTDRPVRVEEIKVATHADGRTIGELGLRSHDRVILAVHGAEGWRLHPEPNDRLRAGEVIVAMVTPKGHAELTSKLSSPG